MNRVARHMGLSALLALCFFLIGRDGLADENPVLRIGVSSGPVWFNDDATTPDQQGLIQLVLTELSKRSGLKIELIAQPMSRTYEDFKAGKLDLFLANFGLDLPNADDLGQFTYFDVLKISLKRRSAQSLKSIGLERGVLQVMGREKRVLDLIEKAIPIKNGFPMLRGERIDSFVTSELGLIIRTVFMKEPINDLRIERLWGIRGHIYASTQLPQSKRDHLRRHVREMRHEDYFFNIRQQKLADYRKVYADAFTH